MKGRRKGSHPDCKLIQEADRSQVLVCYDDVRLTIWVIMRAFAR